MRQFRNDDTSPWLERFGDGHDGALTISPNTTYDGAKAGVSGNHSVGAFTLVIDSASTFANGDCIQITQERGTNAGAKEFNKIVSGGGTTSLTLKYPLDNNYYDDNGNNEAQVVEMKEYSGVTINATYTWSATDWNDNDGGRIAFLVNGTLTYAGDISADAKGLTGHGTGSTDPGDTGEGTAGSKIGNSTLANGNGGGGGDGGGGSGGSGGGGGGFGSAGSNGVQRGSVSPGLGGNTVGDATLSNHPMAGGGGSGGGDGSGSGGGSGDGAGGITIRAKTIVQSGSGKIHANGASGGAATNGNSGCGGGGSGGGIDIGCQTGTFGTATIESLGGSGGSGTGVAGGGGGNGRNALRYSNSYTGTASPAFNAVLDEYLSDTFAHEGVFRQPKPPLHVIDQRRKNDRVPFGSLIRPSAAIHSKLVSKETIIKYNIYQIVGKPLLLLYNIEGPDAGTTFVPHVGEPGTWVNPETRDPSTRHE